MAELETDAHGLGAPESETHVTAIGGDHVTIFRIAWAVSRGDSRTIYEDRTLSPRDMLADGVYSPPSSNAGEGDALAWGCWTEAGVDEEEIEQYDLLGDGPWCIVTLTSGRCVLALPAAPAEYYGHWRERRG